MLMTLFIATEQTPSMAWQDISPHKDSKEVSDTRYEEDSAERFSCALY